MPLASEIFKSWMGDDYQPPSNSKWGKYCTQQGVKMTPEFERILALPRRALNLDQVKDLTCVFQKPGGTMRLRPIQSAALWEAEELNGLFAPIGVGFGKTLITLLVPFVLQAKKTVLFVPPQLRDHLLNPDPNLDGTLAFYAKHFNIPDGIKIYGYSELSSPKKSELLDEEQPDLIVADEAHNFRNRASARTKRFMRYMKKNPTCRFVALSGTMTSKSIRDYADLIELALRKFSPLPYRWSEVNDWADALDVTPQRQMAPGKLMLLCRGKENVRQGFARRFVESKGVVSTPESSVGTSLQINLLRGFKSQDIDKRLVHLRNTWEIEGNELVDAMAFSRVARQVAFGFYYKWDWPNGEADIEWLEARKNWHRELRELLRYHSRPGLDSPLLFTNAVRRGEVKSEHFSAWEAVSDRPEPPTVPVWFTDDFVHEILRWGSAQKEPSIIWYEHDAIGQRLADAGLPWYGGGTSPQESRENLIVCSIKAHGTGKNMQWFNKNLVVGIPASGLIWEQLIGRTHRPGQQADLVEVDVPSHTEELSNAWNSALDSARYIEDTQSQPQRLLYATKILKIEKQ